MKQKAIRTLVFCMMMNLVCGVSEAAPVADRTNVILITVDTLRADRLEAYGYEGGRTPTTTALARESILFENVLVQTPITLPSHASIFTGTYPFYHGLQDVVGHLRKGIPTIAEWFKENGYLTGAFVGSSVLLARWGLDRGFDVYEDNFPVPGIRQVDFSRVERPAERVVSLALSWLEANRNSSFFLWIHLYDPHDPYAPPEPFKQEFGDNPYDGEIAYVEAQLAKFFLRLKEWGLYERSLIIFTSDHGESLGEHDEEYHAYYLYDASLRIPLIFKVPPQLSKGRFQAGSKVGNQVRSVDIAPTIIQLMGEPIPDSMQGEGLVGLMTGRRRDLELPVYAETHYPRIHFGWSSLFSYSTATHKYIEAPIPELYDLQKDARELTNVFEKQSVLANQLKSKMYELQRQFAPMDPQALSGEAEADAETIERLKSLGYVAFSAGKSTSEPGGILPDPKLKIKTYNRMNRAIKLSREGDSQAAIEIFREVAQDEPEMPIAHFMIGSEYFRMGLYLKAAEEFTETIRRNPDSNVARFNLARSYAESGLSSKAEEAAEELLKLEPANYGARHLLASLMAKRGDYGQAVKEELAVLEARPGYLPALNNLGSYYLKMGDPNRAIQAYRRGVDLDSKNIMLHNNLTLAYLNGKRYEEALELALFVTQAAPRNSLGHYYLGQAYAAKGMQDEARNAFRRAQELDPRLKIPAL